MPSFLAEACATPSMVRLQDVGMHCGLEYTSYPYFAKVGAYSRFAHSVGVAMIAYHFSKDRSQAFAGLYHDIATPCFSHVVDFLQGDHERQESTEEATRAMIQSDPKNLENLSKSQLDLEEVADYHAYPICDNDSPRLSADRLEYTLANFLHFNLTSQAEAQSFYDDLIVAQNEDGQPEIAFQSPELAHRFGLLMMKNADMYTRKEDRYAMEMASRLLNSALKEGIIGKDDLYGTERELIQKLVGSKLASAWKDFARLNLVTTSPLPGKEPFFFGSIMTKKRWIDPLVLHRGRLSAIDKEFADEVSAFLALSFDETLFGYGE